MNYKSKSAVLFIIFNRPDLTRQVFAKIRAAQPKRLYIAADGPRELKPADNMLCQQCRELINEIDWDCEVETLFKENNVGCKEAVSSAISWFFEHEEEGIILEDDCLPADTFFNFCDTLLEKYRFDTRIRHISGCNLQQGKKWGSASYYFSNMTHVWGWASWRRVWKDYDSNLTRYDYPEAKIQLEKIFYDPFILKAWLEIFKELKAGRIDTWDYQLTFMNFFNNSLSIIPNVNLISNIGFGADATHTYNTESPNANIHLSEITEISHPLYILPEKQADNYTLELDFDIAYKWKKHNLLRRRFKRWLKAQFTKKHSVINDPKKPITQ